jgi:hypothetical protein
MDPPVAPRDDYEARRRYLPGTNVLESRFETEAGACSAMRVLAPWSGQRCAGLGAYG